MNGMKAQLLTVTLFTSFSGVLCAADPMLLNLLAPDAKVVAGVNVEQAKGTQFGQYILNQVQTADAHLQELVTLTGFDPRRDVRELLVSSDGVPNSKKGLVLAAGNFDVAKITAAAAAHNAATEAYGGNTILEDPKKEYGLVFLSPTMVAAGDLASVRGAIDRQTAAQPLPAALLVKINQWSTSQDAWGISAVPPAILMPPPPAKTGATTPPSPVVGAAQSVQAAAGGVKFGANVVFSGEATCDTAQNAATLRDLTQLMLNFAQMQTANNPEAAALIKSATVNANGTVVKMSASLPQDMFIQMLAPHAQAMHAVPHPAPSAAPKKGK
jgi:hypothetical protein